VTAGWMWHQRGSRMEITGKRSYSGRRREAIKSLFFSRKKTEGSSLNEEMWKEMISISTILDQRREVDCARKSSPSRWGEKDGLEEFVETSGRGGCSTSVGPGVRNGKPSGDPWKV